MKPNRAPTLDPLPAGWHRDETAVSEILGTVLLVGITVVAMGGFGFYFLSIEGPQHDLSADLEAFTHPGTGGWGTGDESVIVIHRGGEALQQTDTRIMVSVDGSPTTIEGAALTDAFADGALSVGERWRYTSNIPDGAPVEVSIVVASGATTTLLLSDEATPIVQAATLPLLGGLLWPAKRRTDAADRHDDQAVASAVGAILLTGILFAFLLMVRVSYVPVWEADVEDAHFGDTETDLTRLGAGLLATGTLREGAAFTQSFVLSPTQQVLMGPMRPHGELEVTIIPDAIRFDGDLVVVFESDGQAVAASADDWQELGAGSTVEDITELRSLRIRVEGMGPTDEGTTFTLLFTDPAGNELGRLTGRIGAANTSGTVVTVDLTTTNAAGEVIGRRTDSVGIALGGNVYFIDALAPELQVATLLLGGDEVDMAISTATGILNPVGGLTDGLVGGATFSFAAAYDQTTSDGSVQTVNPGARVSPFTASIDLARVTYDYAAQYFIDQHYTLEYGAVVVQQVDGASIRTAPGLQIYRAGTDLAISMDMPSGAVDKASAQGARAAIIKAERTSTNSWSGYSSDITLTMQTATPDAWADHWRWSIERAGFSDGAGGLPGVQISTTDDAATIKLTGRDLEPSSRFQDVVLRVASPGFMVAVE